MSYREEVTKAMKMLAEDERTIFIGQTVAFPGSTIFGTLESVPMGKRLEVPVMEEAQLGISIGLSLEGFIPVSIYPRMDFFILAINQLVNHLDKIEEMSHGFNPKVIIRTIVGSTSPLNPGPQHTGDYTEMLKACLTNVDVVKLTRTEDIVPAYRRALESENSTILIEIGDLYNA